MSTNVGSIHYDLGLDTKKFDSAVAGISSKTQAVGKTMTSLGAKMTLGVTVPAALMGAAILKSAIDLEKTSTAFKVLIGNTEKAQKVFAQIKKFADTTPFEFPELAKASTILLGYGVAADDVMDRLKRLGDAAAASGGDLNHITLAYGQMIGRGKVTGDNLRQLTENMVTLRAELSKVSGVPMKDLDKAIENGEISTTELNKALDLATNKGGKFFGGTAKLAETFGGRLSTLKDTIFETGRNLFGLRVDPKLGLTVVKGGLFDRLTEVLPKISKFAKEVGDNFSKLPAGMQNMIVAGGLLLVVLGPLLVIMGSLVSAIVKLIPLFANPVFLVIAGILALIAGAAYLVWKNWAYIKPHVDQAIAGFKVFWQTIKPLRDFIASQWKVAMAEMKKAWVDIQAALKPYMPQLMQAMKVMALFSAVVVVVFVAAIVAMVTVIARVIGWFSKLQAWVVGTVSKFVQFYVNVTNAMNRFYSGVVNNINKAINWFRTLRSRILGAVAGFGSLLYNAGANLINGLSNGITGKINGVINTIRNMAGDVRKAFEHVLDMRSPSKVFYNYGKNITQGLINGIGARKATVKVATEDMAGVVKSAGAGATMAGGQTTIYGNITIGSQSDADYFFARMTRNQELSGKSIATRAGALG